MYKKIGADILYHTQFRNYIGLIIGLNRTTCSLESCNDRLSIKLEKHGLFLKFLEVIWNKDFAQSISFTQVTAGAEDFFDLIESNDEEYDEKLFE